MAKRLNWETLLSTKRVSEFGYCGPKKEGIASQFEDPRSQYERDFDQLVYSYPFRRLQDKTQVIPFPKYDFVHNRLTHSIEVASVGRSLGKLAAEIIFKELDPKFIQENRLCRNDIGALVGAACLAHDIGNPPFGHSGEEAISYYFTDLQMRSFEPNYHLIFEWAPDYVKSENGGLVLDNCGEEICLDKVHVFADTKKWTDLTSFEGNANGFKIVTCNCAKGINPSAALIGTFTKYPRESWLTTEINGEKSKDKSQSKYGFFQEQRDLFQEIAKELGLIRIEGIDPYEIAYKRHPLAFLMEAADDIANCIIDFEDGCRLGLIDFEKGYTFEGYADSISPKDILCGIAKIDKSYKPHVVEEAENTNQAITYLRSKIINILTHYAFNIFKENYEDIMSGKFDHALVDCFEDKELNANLSLMKKLVVNNVYHYTPVLETEASGFEVMGALIDAFASSCNICHSCGDKESSKTKKLKELLPLEYRSEHEATEGELSFDDKYQRVMKIIDYVSGMTDNYASSLYRRIKGITLPRS